MQAPSVSDIEAPPARKPCSPAQVDILTVEEEERVKSTQLLKGPPPDKYAGGGAPIRLQACGFVPLWVFDRELSGLNESGIRVCIRYRKQFRKAIVLGQGVWI
jgi:hypothetical protein